MTNNIFGLTENQLIRCVKLLSYLSKKKILLEVENSLERFYGQEVYSSNERSFSDRSNTINFIFNIIRLANRFVIFNFICLVAIITFSGIYRYPVGQPKIFQYGVTRNNLLALNKLNNCLSKEVNECIAEMSRNLLWKERVKSLISIRFLWYAATLLANNNYQNALVYAKVAIGMGAVIVYSSRPLPSSVEVVCIASDHSPVARALIALSKLEGRKTCYVQHAPVTKYFPPLSTDLSILYDDKSIQAYREASELSGTTFDAEVQLMPPFSECFRSPTLSDGPYIVGVCLSRFPDTSTLKKFLNELSKREDVTDIFLRRHPACKLDLSLLKMISKVSFRDIDESLFDFSSSISLAIVPNSGVTVELLHLGVPTFYKSGLDDIAEDYYGFLEEEILPSFHSSNAFSSTFCKNFFDERWKQRFSKYDLTVYRSIWECRQRVGTAFAKLMR
ncbi:hypothetical protein [Marinobacter sp. OP 3.4]|uniref:hypothetical protein n=1 Tax=Marinobacter sp. OP 3.4 TaxID=3076501 RepID=UPI002E1C93FF